MMKGHWVGIVDARIANRLESQVARLEAAIRAKDAALREALEYLETMGLSLKIQDSTRAALSPDAGKGCEHEWEVDTSIPVQDFGRYGVRFGACRRCGVGGNTDGITGKWKPKRALDALKGAPGASPRG